ERVRLRSRLDADAAEWTSRREALRDAGAALLPPGQREALAGARGNVARLSVRLRGLAAGAARR
ncbi:MAG TPA: hypothetical protein VIG88_06740, partial [Lysobacter sp.]